MLSLAQLSPSLFCLISQLLVIKRCRGCQIIISVGHISSFIPATQTETAKLAERLSGIKYVQSDKFKMTFDNENTSRRNLFCWPRLVKMRNFVDNHVTSDLSCLFIFEIIVNPRYTSKEYEAITFYIQLELKEIPQSVICPATFL